MTRSFFPLCIYIYWKQSNSKGLATRLAPPTFVLQGVNFVLVKATKSYFLDLLPKSRTSFPSFPPEQLITHTSLRTRGIQFNLSIKNNISTMCICKEESKVVPLLSAMLILFHSRLYCYPPLHVLAIGRYLPDFASPYQHTQSNQPLEGGPWNKAFQRILRITFNQDHIL